MITAIGDIRRFRTAAKLKAFAGYHLFEDGTRARRAKGRVSNWNMELKQAVYLLCEQTVHTARTKSNPWRDRLNQRKAFELYKLLRTRQAEADAMGLNVEILPAAYRDRVITCVNDFTPEDYQVSVPTGKKTAKGKDIFKPISGLAFHVDQLRALAGVKSISDDEEEELATDEPEDEEAKSTVKDPKLAKLVRGLKMTAMQKGMRWLGQKFLEHIFASWREAIGLSAVVHKTESPQKKNSSDDDTHTPNPAKSHKDDSGPVQFVDY